MWTPSAALPESQAGTAYYYRVVPARTRSARRSPTPSTPSTSSAARWSSNRRLLAGGRQRAGGRARPTDHAPEPAGLPERRHAVVAGLPDHREVHDTGDARPLQSPGRTEARSYVVQTATDAGFNELIETVEVDQTTFTSFDTTYPEGPVYWRVRAVDGSAQQPRLERHRRSSTRCRPLRCCGPRTAPRRSEATSSSSGTRCRSQRSTASRSTATTTPPRTRSTGPCPARPCESRTVSLTDLLPQLPQMPNGDDPYVWRFRRIDAAGRKAPGATGATSGSSSPPRRRPRRRQRPGRPVGRAVHLVGRPWRRELPLRATAGRQPHHIEPITTRAMSWAPQLAIAGGSWEWRVTPIDAAGNNMTPVRPGGRSRSRTPWPPPAHPISGSGRVARRSRSPLRPRGTSGPRSPRPTSGSGAPPRSAARPARPTR